MDFRIERRGETVVVGVPGPLIVGNRTELKDWVLDALDKGEKKFLIDFSQTGFVDSSGLGVIVTLRKKISERGGELRLSNLSPELKRVFELAKIDALFPEGWDESDNTPTS